MIKTKKEEIERCEKRLAALLGRVPSRDRRRLQKEIDECIAFILRHHQLAAVCIRIIWHLSCERCMRSADVLNTTDINMSMCLKMRSRTLVHVPHQVQTCRCPCGATPLLSAFITELVNYASALRCACTAREAPNLQPLSPTMTWPRSVFQGSVRCVRDQVDDLKGDLSEIHTKTRRPAMQALTLRRCACGYEVVCSTYSWE